MSTRLTSTRLSRFFVRSLAIILGAMGITLYAGGAYLWWLGGSSFFFALGAALCIAGLLVFRYKPMGAVIFALAYTASLIWAVHDAGLTFWPLMSRLSCLSLLAVLVASLYPALCRAAGKFHYHPLSNTASFVISIALVFAWISVFTTKGSFVDHEPLAVLPIDQSELQISWTDWGGSHEGQRFSALDQITKNNVHRLKVAWVARKGEWYKTHANGLEQNTPIQAADTLFTCSPDNQVFAINVDSGEILWQFDPNIDERPTQHCRSLGYFSPKMQNAENTTACSTQIFLSTSDDRLIALDAKNGNVCKAFGNDGVVELLQDTDMKSLPWLHPSTPMVINETIIIGDSRHRIHAIALDSGKTLWSWHPLDNSSRADEQQNEFNFPSSHVKSWGEFAYDASLKTLYIPTHSSSHEGTEIPAALNALDVKNGNLKWKFSPKSTHSWDLDLTSQPTLTGRILDDDQQQLGLILATKQGEIFHLDRTTGALLNDNSALDEGKLPPKQIPSIGNKSLSESDMWGLTLIDQLFCRITFKSVTQTNTTRLNANEKPVLQYPGVWGGIGWGGVSYDRNNHVIFVNDSRMGRIVHWSQEPFTESSRQEHNQNKSTSESRPLQNDFVSILGIPCQAPPYGTLSAISLKHNKIIWQIPIGTLKDQAFFDTKVRLKIPVGLPSRGPSLITQSGLIFLAATQDYYLRAFDAANGKEVWRSRLPVASQAGPMSYISPKTGVQYIVVNAGGAWRSSNRGDYLIAFALDNRIVHFDKSASESERKNKN